MALTDDQIAWLQRNKAMSGGSDSVLPASSPTSAPQVSAAAGSPQPTSTLTAQASSAPASAPAASAPTSGPNMITVYFKTKYGQNVRYWIQDKATDANNEVAPGSGRVLVNGEEHGPDETITLPCIETANGASICYQRESYPNPPGGGMTPWSSTLISAGSTFEPAETPQGPSQPSSSPSSAPASAPASSPASSPAAATTTPASAPSAPPVSRPEMSASTPASAPATSAPTTSTTASSPATSASAASAPATSAPASSAPPPASAPVSSASTSAPLDDAGKALPATDTVMFFEKDSADLTPDDRAALDRYAANYAAAGLTDPVKVEAWASVEGDANHNQTLAGQRAKTVADYLASKGIAKVSGHGNGPTPQFGTDLESNRRAMLSPKPPAAPGPTGPAQPWTFNPTQPTAPNLNLPPPPPIPPALDPADPNAQYDAQGYGDGLNGRTGVCLVDPKADKAYQGGYARGTADRQVWQQTLNAVMKLPLPNTTGLPPQSASDVLAKALEAGLKPLIDKLPQAWRDPLRKALPGIVASAVAQAAKSSLPNSALSGAAAALTEAALKIKDGGPPMDRKQDTSGPGAPDRDPPQRTPPQASPQPPPVPGQQTVTTPPVNTPDTPPPKPSPNTDGGP
jgi:outer membrane protein OmpA-like peptidoglycan-associated protein